MSAPEKEASLKLEFNIRSHDSNRTNDELVQQIIDRKADLLESIKKKLQEAEEVEVLPEKAFGTGLLEVILVAFLIGAAKGAGKVTGEKAAEAIIEWVGEEFNDVEIIQLHLSDDTPTE